MTRQNVYIARLVIPLRSENMGYQAIQGATTVGLICSDGVVLASEKRVSYGRLVASTRGKKVFKLTDNVGLAFAGLMSDMQALVREVSAYANLFRLEKNRPISTKALTLKSTSPRSVWPIQMMPNTPPLRASASSMGRSRGSSNLGRDSLPPKRGRAWGSVLGNMVGVEWESTTGAVVMSSISQKPASPMCTKSTTMPNSFMRRIRS